MSKKSRPVSVARHAVRPGEGAALHVTRVSRVGVDGKTTAALGVNLASAPVPERKYVADVFDVSFEDGLARLLFGQARIDGKGLRSLLVIHLGGEAAAHFMESTSAKSGPDAMTFEQSLESLKLNAAKPMKNMEEPTQTVALKASAMYSAFSGVDSCIDFYQISPASIHLSRNSDYLGVDPVVRVDMRTPILLGVIDSLREHAKQGSKGNHS